MSSLKRVTRFSSAFLSSLVTVVGKPRLRPGSSKNLLERVLFIEAQGRSDLASLLPYPRQQLVGGRLAATGLDASIREAMLTSPTWQSDQPAPTRETFQLDRDSCSSPLTMLGRMISTIKGVGDGCAKSRLRESQSNYTATGLRHSVAQHRLLRCVDSRGSEGRPAGGAEARRSTMSRCCK